MSWTRYREIIESEDGKDLYYYSTEEEDNDIDNEYEEDYEDAYDHHYRQENPSHEGPYCHEETWEEPEASVVCPICGRKMDQPPPSLDENEFY